MEYAIYGYKISMKIGGKIYLLKVEDNVFNITEISNIQIYYSNITDIIPHKRYVRSVIGYNNDMCLYNNDTYKIYEFKGYYITYKKNTITGVFLKLLPNDYWFWRNIPTYTSKYYIPTLPGYTCTDDGVLFYYGEMFNVKLEEFKIYELEDEYTYILHDDTFYCLDEYWTVGINMKKTKTYNFIKGFGDNISLDKIMIFLLCIKYIKIKLPKYIIYQCCYY